MSTTKTKRGRAARVNEAIQIISNHGRRFFYNSEHDRVAHIQVDDRGTVWFVDDYTGQRINTHKAPHSRVWKNFSHGGTLRALVEAFRDYILTGEAVSPHLLGPETSWTNGNVWGYEPQAMKNVRQQAGLLPVFKQAVEKADD